MKFEYRFFPLSDEGLGEAGVMEKLNSLAREGWVLLPFLAKNGKAILSRKLERMNDTYPELREDTDLVAMCYEVGAVTLKGAIRRALERGYGRALEELKGRETKEC